MRITVAQSAVFWEVFDMIYQHIVDIAKVKMPQMIEFLVNASYLHGFR